MNITLSPPAVGQTARPEKAWNGVTITAIVLAALAVLFSFLPLHHVVPLAVMILGGLFAAVSVTRSGDDSARRRR